jgi:hypothetical protein
VAFATEFVAGAIKIEIREFEESCKHGVKGSIFAKYSILSHCDKGTAVFSARYAFTKSLPYLKRPSIAEAAGDASFPTRRQQFSSRFVSTKLVPTERGRVL